MSRVTITDLVEGETATAANYNANMTSWNTATADGSVGANNVREQGIDRRPIADRTIDLTMIGSGFWFISNTASALIVAGAAVAVVTMGGNPVRIGPAEVGLFSNLLVECSIYASGNAAGPSAGTNGQSMFRLQRSPDNAVWTDVSESQQVFSTHGDMLTAFTGVATFRWRGTYTTTVLHSGGTGTTWYYRLVASSQNVDVTVNNAVLYFRMEAS